MSHDSVPTLRVDRIPLRFVALGLSLPRLVLERLWRRRTILIGPLDFYSGALIRGNETNPEA